MAVVLGLEDEVIIEACRSIENEIVIPANFNSPGQVVISGRIMELNYVQNCWKRAKRVLTLSKWSFHSPLWIPHVLNYRKFEGTQFRNLYVRYTKTYRQAK